MRHATFTEVRNQAKQYFDAVEAGETVRVLRNGKPIADIVPIMADPFLETTQGATLGAGRRCGQSDDS